MWQALFKGGGCGASAAQLWEANAGLSGAGSPASNGQVSLDYLYEKKPVKEEGSGELLI